MTALKTYYRVDQYKENMGNFAGIFASIGDIPFALVEMSQQDAEDVADGKITEYTLVTECVGTDWESAEIVCEYAYEPIN
jgi:hypothetical protein